MNHIPQALSRHLIPNSLSPASRFNQPQTAPAEHSLPDRAMMDEAITIKAQVIPTYENHEEWRYY
jgi:hypothetical protein